MVVMLQLFTLDFAAMIKFRPKVTVKDGLFIPHVVGTRLKGQAIYDSIGAHYGNEHRLETNVLLCAAMHMITPFVD